MSLQIEASELKLESQVTSGESKIDHIDRKEDTQRTLVNQAKQGSNDAFSALWQELSPRVQRYMLARSNNLLDAEDLSQEVFMKVYRSIDRFQWRGIPFSAWVFRIAHNEVISHSRKQAMVARRIPKSTQKYDRFQDHLDLQAEIENKVMFEQAITALALLSDLQRDVIYWRFVAGLSVDQTAQLVGKSTGRVKTVQHRAIAKLRKILQTEWDITVNANDIKKQS